MSRVLLTLDCPDVWPATLRDYLDTHHDLFLNWETASATVGARAYDDAIAGLRRVLDGYAITGWHCTRLTDVEMDQIVRMGMQLPDGTMLRRRIEALVAAGVMTSDVALRLVERNQANDANRVGMLWFCFFAPRLAGESGVARFFRHWGGEALYNSHERDPGTSSVLHRIGTPCLVEVDVPIAALARHGAIAFNIVRRFLMSRGHCTDERVHHEDRIVRPLGTEYIRRVIRFPEQEFVAMTDCSSWRIPLESQ